MMSSLKNTIDFEIILPDFEFWCEFSQRITILRCMNDRIERDFTARISAEIPKECVRCEYPVVHLHEDSWRQIIEGTIDSVIIADNLICMESFEFADFCEKFLERNNLFLVIISRADLNNLDRLLLPNAQDFGQLSFGLRTVYNVVTNGTKFWLEETKSYRITSKKVTGVLDCF